MTEARALQGGNVPERARSFARRLLRSVDSFERVVSVSILLFWAAIIVLAPLLSLANPSHQDLGIRLEPPTGTHFFGTDELGRDVFSRVLLGAGISVPAAILVVAIAFPLGTVIGAVAGYVGGAVEEVLMRLTDMFLAFPLLVLAMAVAAALGASLLHSVIALVTVWWPPYVRVTRGMVLDLKNRDYVVASRAAGTRPISILARVIMPNVLPPLLVMAAIDIGRSILFFAMLGFLGLGAKAPEPEWGLMIASGSSHMDQWWVATFPGLAILSLVFAFNLAGDSIRDALDPWVRGRR